MLHFHLAAAIAGFVAIQIHVIGNDRLTADSGIFDGNVALAVGGDGCVGFVRHNQIVDCDSAVAVGFQVGGSADIHIGGGDAARAVGDDSSPAADIGIRQADAALASLHVHNAADDNVMAIVSVDLANGHIAFLGADGERAFAALSVAQNADVLHGHIAAVFHVSSDLSAVFHGDILKPDIALVDIKVNAAAVAHIGVMEIDIGLDQRLCVGFTAVGAVRTGSDNLEIGGVAAEGLENDGVVFLEDIAIVGGNDLEIVGDHIGIVGIADAITVAVVVILVVIQRGILAAEENGDALTGEGVRHFHQSVGLLKVLHLSVGDGLEHAGGAVGGVPCSVGQKDHGGGLGACGAVLAFQHIHDHIAGCVGDSADIGAVEEVLHRIVGVFEAHCGELLFVHGQNRSQLQLHKAAAAVGEVVAVEVAADGPIAVHSHHTDLADTLRRHVNAGGGLMEVELRPTTHVDGASADFRVGFRSAKAASLIIDTKQSIGRVRANHLAVLIQVQQGSLGQVAGIVQDDPGVPVYDAVAVTVAVNTKADIATFAVRHVGDVHAVSARGGDGHGSLGVIVVGCELAMLPQNLRNRFAVFRQFLKVHGVAEDAAVGTHIEILCAILRLNLACGGVDGVAFCVVHQLRVGKVDLSIRSKHETYRLQGLNVAFARYSQFRQHLLIGAVHTIAVEIRYRVVIARILILEL